MTSIILFLIGYAIVYPENMGICDRNNDVCIFRFPVFTIGEPLLISSFFFILTSLALFWANDNAFKIWKKFAVIYLPILVLVIIIAPATGSGLLDLNKEFFTQWLAGIFFVVSLGIIFGKREKQSSI